MFCRKVCEVALFNGRENIGGPGKLVQIDESKIGKRKHHCGHVIEGQWVFGSIEEDSQKCFIVTVEDQTEQQTSIEFVNREGFHTNKIEGHW